MVMQVTASTSASASASANSGTSSSLEARHAVNSSLEATSPESARTLKPLIPAKFTRAQVFEKLTSTIFLNELGLPKFLYRSDLIPDEYPYLTPQQQRQYQNIAAIEVTYSEGYPTFLNGMPIWEQMDHEVDEDFVLFQFYRDLTLTMGYRQISALPTVLKDAYAQYTASGNEVVRQHANAMVEKATFKPRELILQLTETALINFWYLRVKAYDMFVQVSHRKKREQRLMKMETYQYDRAEEILNKLSSAINSVLTAERMEGMDPLDFIKAFEKAADIQRKALNPNGSAGSSRTPDGAPPPGASFELVMRNLARTTQVDTAGGNAKSNGAGSIMDFVDNPEAAEAAQEFILKVNIGNRSTAITKGENGDTSTSRDEAQDLAMITGEDD